MPLPILITSRQNQRVKDAVRLRDGGIRQRQQRFIIDGTREIRRACESGVRCLEAFVCNDLVVAPDSREAVGLLQRSGAELLPVSTEVYEKLAFGQRDDGIVVVAETPVRTLAQLVLPSRPLIAVIEGVEKPGNLGAILRSADAAGVDAVVVANGRTDLFNPNTIRASLGTVFRKNVCTATTAATLNWLDQLSISILAARPDATALYTSVDMSVPLAIVLGSEAHGLSAEWQRPCVRAVRLPMHGMADSLNVSTTAAILFYEALRQRASR